ncbi:MAG: diacylglycerol kinase family protein [Cytophagales bacterium]
MRRLFKSFGFAINGLVTAWREQLNLKIHAAIAFLVLIVGWQMRISKYEWSVVILCIGVVLAAELFNSAIEKWVDLVQPQRNETAGRIKDISAAAVLVVALAAAVVGVIVFLTSYFNRIS